MSCTSSRPGSQPLYGKRILVTRAREQADALSRLLRAAGAVPVAIPAIQIEPPASWEDVDRAVAQMEQYDWIVFTSANGVRSFFRRLRYLGHSKAILGNAKVAAIGPGTAEVLGAFGIGADLIPGEYVAEAVAAGLAERGIAGAKILLARAAEAREALATLLRARGAQVEEVAVYRTVVPSGSRSRLRALLATSGLDAATFTSSSTVRNTVAMLGEGAAASLNRLAIACIGPITAQTARELGLRVDVIAGEYTIAGLVRALAEYFTARKQEAID